MKKLKYKRIISLGLNYFRFNNFDANFLKANSVDIVRLNFSHLDHKLATNTVNFFRNNYKNIKILQDLQGQKWRVSTDIKKMKYQLMKVIKCISAQTKNILLIIKIILQKYLYLFKWKVLFLRCKIV